jgi:ABC-type branched-subunit amino acid transport system substrate-binding protein
MGKQGQWLAAAAAVLTTGCATLPEVQEPERRPEQPAERPVETPRAAPIRIGVVLSQTGSPVLQRYAELVLEGVRLGADQQSTAQRGVELVIRDDGGTAAGAVRAVRELEQAGVRAIVGPLVEDALAEAARARSSDGVWLISPTAVTDPVGPRNVLALNVVDTRGAIALGEYARRYARVGVLYSSTQEASRQARAFADAYAAGGRGTVREVTFAPGTSNVAQQLSQLRAARVEAVFFPGAERELQVILPQVEYFGLAGVQLLGTETWLSEGLRGVGGVPDHVLQGAIVATSLVRESADVAWREFVALYEARHRRSLENAIPALGFDAAVLAVQAAAAGAPYPGEHRGATGVLALQDDAVTRRPFLVRIDAGRLIPIR